MSKEVAVVFQDCFLCGVEGQQKIEELETKGIKLRKVSFVSEEGREIIHQAVMVHKIKGLPIFTDGETFSKTLEPWQEAEEDDTSAENNQKNDDKATTSSGNPDEKPKMKGKKHNGAGSKH